MVDVLSTDQKGTIAETAIAALAARHGVTVLKPVGEGTRYDLVFAIGARFLRVQCKWSPTRDDVVIVNLTTSRRVADGHLRTTYRASEVDLVAVYVQAIDRSFLLEPNEFEGHPALHLRVGRPRNNQKLGIRWADDYDFDARLERHLDGATVACGSNRLSADESVERDAAGRPTLC